jgi:DNA polymerase-1
MLGADASGLELRCLAHYMAKYDNGAYGKIILEGDIHTENRKALGSLVPQDNKGRDMAKTFIYAYLYGAGDEKLGSIVAPHETPERQKEIGAQLRKNFEGNTPCTEVSRREREAEDKRTRIPDDTWMVVAHTSDTNTLHSTRCCKARVQSSASGGLSPSLGRCGRSSGSKAGGNWAAMLWSHDEIQVAVREDIAERASRIAVESIEAMTTHFKFRCPLTGEAKLGRNWAETAN